MTNIALIEAVKGNNVLKVERLLFKNNNINLQDSLGRTALHYAALLGHEKIIDLLLKKNARIKILDRLGMTATQLAKMKHFKSIVNLINDYEMAAPIILSAHRLLTVSRSLFFSKPVISEGINIAYASDRSTLTVVSFSKFQFLQAHNCSYDAIFKLFKIKQIEEMIASDVFRLKERASHYISLFPPSEYDAEAKRQVEGITKDALNIIKKEIEKVEILSKKKKTH